MEFNIKKGSPIPIIEQIQVQIKLAISMGVLKRGDILPSIREVEKQTGINRGKIYRAFLALQKSGLLAPAPGKRIAVAISAAAPAPLNKKCRKLTRSIIQEIRKMGVSPMAFARYLSQSAQEDERKSPFIAYVDLDKEVALRRAEQTSRLWQASVIGLSMDELKIALANRRKPQKILVNHLGFDNIRRIHRGRKIDIIPIEITHSVETIRALRKIKENSSLLIVFSKQASPIAPMAVEQLQKLKECENFSISWAAVKDAEDFKKLLKKPQYERILVSPEARNKVPAGQQRNSRILQFQMEFTPEGLEVARIRAGVIL
jgi:DNA-binding transcriptional regulator YhcF (GntR family)